MERYYSLRRRALLSVFALHGVVFNCRGLMIPCISIFYKQKQPSLSVKIRGTDQLPAGISRKSHTASLAKKKKKKTRRRKKKKEKKKKEKKKGSV